MWFARGGGGVRKVRKEEGKCICFSICKSAHAARARIWLPPPPAAQESVSDGWAFVRYNDARVRQVIIGCVCGKAAILPLFARFHGQTLKLALDMCAKLLLSQFVANVVPGRLSTTNDMFVCEIGVYLALLCKVPRIVLLVFCHV